MGDVKPLAIDLFSGLHGWAEGLAAAGFEVIAFDLEDMCAKLSMSRPAGIQLVLQDVRTLHGRQFRDAALIVASPPCQAYSWRAMPWKAAKAAPPPSNELFEACFRLQREACEAAGRYIPMVVENVRGAQPWVGRARWHHGAYFLWGDVPALMPHSWRNAIKQPGLPGRAGDGWFGANNQHSLRQHSSKSPKRKAASALIAKIPFELASWIGRVYYPRTAPADVGEGVGA